MAESIAFFYERNFLKCNMSCNDVCQFSIFMLIPFMLIDFALKTFQSLIKMVYRILCIWLDVFNAWPILNGDLYSNIPLDGISFHSTEVF